MTTNINFSFTRLMAVMKRDMIENWKTNMYRLIGVYTGAKQEKHNMQVSAIPFILY